MVIIMTIEIEYRDHSKHTLINVLSYSITDYYEKLYVEFIDSTKMIVPYRNVNYIKFI